MYPYVSSKFLYTAVDVAVNRIASFLKKIPSLLTVP